MEWMIFALLAPALWTIPIIIDKFLLDKFVKDPISYSIVMELLWLVFIFGVIIAKPISIAFPLMILGILAGMIGMGGYFIYCKVIQIEEVSRVISLTYVSSLFTAFFAFFIFREIFTFQKYLGILLIVIGAISLSYRRKTRRKIKKRLSILRNLPIIPSLALILVMSLFGSLVSILDKYVLFSVDYWSLFVWIALGELVITSLVLLKSGVRKNLQKTLRNLKINKKFFAFAFITEILAFFGLIASLIAISLGPVSLVSALSAVCPLYLLFGTILLSIFIPKVLKEEISKSTVALKIFSTLLIVIGTSLIVLA